MGVNNRTAHGKAVALTAKKLGLSQNDVDNCVKWFMKELVADLFNDKIKSIRLPSIGSVIRLDKEWEIKRRDKKEEDDSKEKHKKHIFLSRRVQTL